MSSLARNKLVYFNLASDAEIYEYAQQIPNFSKWVKDQIRRGMERKSQKVDADILKQCEIMIENRLCAINALPPSSSDDDQYDISEDVTRFF